MELSNSTKKVDILHTSFEIGILIKGIDGILEIIGGFLLLFFNPVKFNNLVILLTQHELSEDPKDLIANFLLRISHDFSISAQHFAVFYLISHGIVKFILVSLLWKKKILAYPLTIAFLIIFIIYQVYRYTFSHSFWLVILTIFDAVMIVLTLIEYKKIKDSNGLVS
ncbi:MAG: DUF2127 domain-containing protein [Ignavibacteriales bacterium]